jgi:hypothetical protein
MSGDNEAPKDAVIELFDAAGFFPIDLGDLVSCDGTGPLAGPRSGHYLVQLRSEWTMAELASAGIHLWDEDPTLPRTIGKHPDFDPWGWMAELPPMDLYGALVPQVVGQ